jgi:hypothetical protein
VFGGEVEGVEVAGRGRALQRRGRLRWLRAKICSSIRWLSEGARCRLEHGMRV